MLSPDSALRLPSIASDRLILLARAAVDGGALAKSALRRRYGGELVAKGPRDFVTAVDVAVEELIVARLRSDFPDHAISGEEAVGNLEAAEDAPCIHIDPIDGTTNYAWGIPHFGLTIAISEGGKITCGVVFDVMQDELFVAERGKGAFLNGERLLCRPLSTVEEALIGAGLPIPGQVRSVTEDRYFHALRRLMAQTAGVRRLGSAALSLAYVAAGRLDGFFEDGLSLHDYGASCLVIEEAGGMVTGFGGGPISRNGDVLASNGGMHAWLLEGLAGP
ncbi:inositol monophosphatase family protein [Rhizobium sp. SSA_523]|uniref:inositol monophosphatase family protein n=1 Tax=Rhizobium sp. SSA_523 TaxID=2952477 RepID=UPI00209083ED|nr:inositol monophosphatase family protein [Rhizobium sp. SSA_523]MCO5732959.1 inositol monophosphatase [Rhizobium sp. SSA_523]WKC23844.1 inositol monophosphatase family protein [Rhizobium sp. SSA_523]